MIQTRTALSRICDSLYFLHIPKTAGTSVRYWLNDLFGYQDWLPCHIFEEVQRLPRESINEYSFFSGHFGWRLLDYLVDPPRVVTWLRDPVQREWSTIRFIRSKFEELADIAIKNDRRDWLTYYEFVKSAPLREILESPRFVGYSDNCQVRHLAGLYPSHGSHLINEDDLATAKHNLQNLYCFGISEWMESSVDFLSFQLNHFHRPMNRRLNVGTSAAATHSQELASEDIALMREVNRFDQELYDFARLLFIDRYKGMTEAIGFNIDTDQIVDWLSDYEQHALTPSIRQAIDARFQELRKEDPRLPGAVVRFAEPTFLRGWHPCVLTPEETVVRWAGPEPRASVFVPLQPGRRYRVEATIFNYASRRMVHTLSLRLGGVSRPASWHQLPADAGQRPQYLVEAVFPAHAVADDVPYTELALEIQGDMGSFAHDPTTKVSVATEGFTITPEDH